MSRSMSAIGTKRTLLVALHMSAFGGKADIDASKATIFFSNSRLHDPQGYFDFPIDLHQQSWVG